MIGGHKPVSFVAPTEEVERRSEVRWDQFAGCVVGLEGNMARLHDICAWGARVEARRSYAIDETVRLDLPWGAPVRAVVLASDDGLSRLRFEFPIEPF
ncbi:MAG TPA: hypothetical protein VMI31_12790 [Fimbriimonadaceae bacterium]|nr:hypothetical protein [Fimbriimonadaceae bacterium]